MLLSTPALVLHTMPYSESSVIAKVFTRQLGLRSYIIKGARSRSSRIRPNLLQPLSSVDMVVYDNPRTTLNHVKEMALHSQPPVPDPVSNALRFFIAEVLYKALQEGEPLVDLFDYVDQLDPQTNPAQIPLCFLLSTARHLGIEPLDNYEPSRVYFDIEQGHYLGTVTDTTLSVSDSLHLHLYLDSLHAGSAPPPVAAADRARLLSALIAYYQIHLSGFHDFKSHEILHDILA